MSKDKASNDKPSAATASSDTSISKGFRVSISSSTLSYHIEINIRRILHFIMPTYGRSTLARHPRGRENDNQTVAEQDRHRARRFLINVLDQDRPPAGNIRSGTSKRRSPCLGSIVRGHLLAPMSARALLARTYPLLMSYMPDINHSVWPNLRRSTATVGLRTPDGSLR